MTQKAYQFRFYPTPEQENLLRRTLGCTRLVYNRALETRTRAWAENQEYIGYSETSALLTEWKKEQKLQFLNEVSCVPLQQGLRHLQKAFNNFFEGRAKYPNFKKKRNGGSAEFTKSAFKFKNGQVTLAKCSEPLPIRWSHQIPQNAEPSTITVKLAPSGRWTVSLLFDVEITPLPATSQQVGIDLGITSLVALSTGEKIANPKTFKAKRAKLKKAQKALARKQKGSKNREKARLKAAKVHQEIADTRKDFLHKLTTRLVRENQTIAIESLAVKNMMSQRVGRVPRLEATGEPVRVKNPKLALAISDSSWGELVRQLEYKCEWYGRTLVKIDQWFPSSKRCSHCGYIALKMPLKIREWECPSCGVVHDRDVNASVNILAAGLAVSVCGATVRPKQSQSVKAGAKPRKGKKQKPRS